MAEVLGSVTTQVRFTIPEVSPAVRSHRARILADGGRNDLTVLRTFLMGFDPAGGAYAFRGERLSPGNTGISSPRSIFLCADISWLRVRTAKLNDIPRGVIEAKLMVAGEAGVLRTAFESSKPCWEKELLAWLSDKTPWLRVKRRY